MSASVSAVAWTHGARRPRELVALAGVVLLAASAVAWIWPREMAARLASIDGVPATLSVAAGARVVQALALPLAAFALRIAAGLVGIGRSSPSFLFWANCGVLGVSFVGMSSALAGWLIDDAAITFAYSENLVRGHGLVLHPSHRPEEAYSSSLWMLALAGLRWLGFGIPAAAKLLGTVCAGLTLGLAAYVVARLSRDGARLSNLLVLALVALGAPFVIWSSSGLEHSLQALLLMLTVAAPLLSTSPMVPALALSALVLVRPETPLIVGAVLLVHALWGWRTSGPHAIQRVWPIVVFPALSLAALLAFRWTYFHDILPNPYYAKAQGATLLRLVNPFGGSWAYVWEWLSGSGFLFVLPLLILGLRFSSELSVALGIAVVAAQLLFVLLVGGDWMGQYRFIAPILPILGVLAARACDGVTRALPRSTAAAALAVSSLVLTIGTVRGLHQFCARPTTPMAVVEQIGKTFVELSSKLGVAHPVLAHHDAGGTSFGARIDLIDLAGLGNRTIAKRQHDAAFLRSYLFTERRPLFIFGSDTTFAAAMLDIANLPEFRADYIPIEFRDRPFMKAALSHVRRDRVVEAPGLQVVRDAEGKAVKLVML